jgi:hypothetical protein
MEEKNSGNGHLKLTFQKLLEKNLSKDLDTKLTPFNSDHFQCPLGDRPTPPPSHQRLESPVLTSTYFFLRPHASF